MADFENLTIHIGKVAEDRWLAATGRSPYFCFEAPSQEEVKKLAQDGLRFYREVLNKHGGSLPRDAAPVTFNATEKVSANNLIAA